MFHNQEIFENRFFILENEKILDFPNVQKVIFVHNNMNTVANLNKAHDQKIVQINFTGDIKESLKFEKKEKQIVKIYPRTEKEIIENSKPLKENNYLICPQFPINNLENISLISSMGLIVDLIHIVDCLDIDISLKILDHYLHYQNLTVPIEPFHTILKSKIQQYKISLWDMNLLNPALFYYCDGIGLSEDPESLKTKEYQFQIDFMTKTFHHLKKDSRIENFFNSLPENQPECMSCPHFHICMGWAVYHKNSCEKWKEILITLQKANREIQALEIFDQENQIKTNSNTQKE